jgi:carboxyl-terminal processing protease
MRLVLGAGFAAVFERHLEAASPADLLAGGLAGLTRLDPALSVTRMGRDVTLSAGGRPGVTGTAPAPPEDRDDAATGAGRDAPARAGGRDDAARAGGATADILTRFHDVAWAASPSLRQAGAPRLIAVTFEAIFTHLDPFSRYVTPWEAQAARARRTGEAGLGLRLAPRRGGAVIAAIAPDGPAAEAGLMVGDRVLAVDGERLRTRDSSTAAEMLEGPAGTAVRLLVQRGRQRRNVVLVRTLPVGNPVSSTREDGVLVIRIPGFTARTQREVAAALLTALASQAPRAVVLDLRGNRGGLLAQAASVADVFLGEGEAFRTVGRHPDSSRIYMTAAPDLSEGLPLVVLVDARTASSAEIVAATLSDRGRAAVAGTATMGKGLVQLVMPLPDGGELLMSWSRLIMPAGWPLQGVGVLPGLCTTGGAAEANRAALAAGARPMGPALSRLRALRHPAAAAEIEALRNTCPPAEGSEADLVAARALAVDPVAHAAAMAR